jgi:glyoxylase-like metal-dependent hydrolase (beta-lactamase superfamily II)
MRMVEVKVTPLLAGSCKHPQIMTIRDGSLRPATYPALPMLIVHPSEGPILFDTGYDPAFLKATQPFPERFYRWLTPVSLAAGEEVATQCSSHGISPQDVRHIVLSHFHADHMAGAHAFPNARIHCAKAGFDAACKGGRISQVRQGILRALIPDDFARRANFFEDCNRIALPSALLPFEAGVDLLGDGALLAVELPGHCPGHWGLLVNDSHFGSHFMIADAAWSLDAVRRNVPPPALSTAFLGHTRRTRETLGKLHQLWKRNPDIRLTPYHCPERAAEAGDAD